MKAMQWKSCDERMRWNMFAMKHLDWSEVLPKNLPLTTNTSELARFLGFTGYYRNFIDQYVAITSTLTQLLHKDVDWYFGPTHITTFELLKKCLVNYPILRLPYLDKPFIIHCDASGSGLGAILAQVDDDNNEYVCESVK